MYPRAAAKMSSCQCMQLEGGEWTIFDKFILGSKDCGNKTKKCIIHCRASRWFLLFYSLKPYSQVWILLHWNWSIVKVGSSFGARKSPALSDSLVHPLLPPPLRRSHFSIIKMKNKTELTLLLLTHPTNHFPWEDDKLHRQCVVPEAFVHPAYTALPLQMS